MRVLHLIDYPARSPLAPRAPRGGGDEAALAAAAVRDASPGVEHLFGVIGPTEGVRRAGGCGARAALHVHPPLRRTELARGALRAAVERAAPDALHAWSVPAAVAAGRSGRRVTATPLDGPDPRVAAALGAAGVELVPLAPPEGGPGVAAATGLAPAIDTRRRDDLRRGAGLAPGSVVLLLLGGCGVGADAWRFVFTASIATAAGADVVALMPGGCVQGGRAARLRRVFNRPGRLIVSDRPLPDLLAAADLALCDAPFTGAAAVSVAAAHRAGVPVIAPAATAPPALYPPGVAEHCVASHGAPGELARLLVALVRDPERRRVLRSALVQARAGDSPLAASLRAAWAGRGPAGAGVRKAVAHA